MLLLTFQAGGARYGLDASGIIEVLPAAELRPVPRAAVYIAGLLNYRGTIAPVLDLNALLTADPARIRLSSRIVIVDFPAADGAHRPLGLLAERAIETIHCRERDFQSPGIRAREAPFSGDVLVDAQGAVQKIDVGRLLPEELQQTLFSPPAANG